MEPSQVATALDWIQAGGTPALVAVLYILWKLDRRILKIEVQMGVEEP